jgi:colanic acid/amylovoran biosynthesis glycosyltransferase
LLPLCMPVADTEVPSSDPRPHVVSLCGTYLKPEMQSIYRQIIGIARLWNTVFAQWVEHEEQFPYQPLVKLTKLHHRPRGNFLKRFWYKHVVKQWPPPVTIAHYVGPCYEWDLVDRLAEAKPDVVHCYYGHKAVGYLPMLRAWGGPWIVSFHGVDVAKDMDDPQHVQLLQQVLTEAQLVLARSHSLLQRLRELGCAEEKLRLNRTPIPLAHLQAKVSSAPSDGKWRFVQACRLIAKKGLFTAVEAMATVVQRYPEAQYILCGVGPQEQKLRDAVAERGLEKNVILLGWLSQQQLLEQYQHAHLFLHPSEMTKEGDQEGVPNSMLEAMACGLPVVATQHGGIPEAVTHAKDGLLVPEKSPAELAAALLRVMEEPGLLQSLSTAAAASVRANYEAGRQVAALEDCYLEAIQRWNATPQKTTSGA